MEEMVDNVLCQLLELLDMPLRWRILFCCTRDRRGIQLIY
jgi:hypothetical protein